MISISGIDKPALLAALFNFAAGHADVAMTPELAKKFIKQRELFDNVKEPYRFDHFRKKRLGVDIARNMMDEREYDRHNGKGRAQAAVEKARAGSYQP
jgi:hypothetical protein